MDNDDFRTLFLRAYRKRMFIHDAVPITEEPDVLLDNLMHDHRKSEEMRRKHEQCWTVAIRLIESIEGAKSDVQRVSIMAHQLQVMLAEGTHGEVL